MVRGLIGKKLGMTQIFDEAGKVIPVTVIRAGPCVVVQKKTEEKEGYSCVQLGFVEGKKTPKVNRALEGHFKKSGSPPSRIVKEFAFAETGNENVSVGDQVSVQDVFQVNDLVNVAGRTIGLGFQGVMKRHGFSGGAATHGSMFHRAPGSIGASASPSRVLPGMRGPGRMGNHRVTVRGLRVVEIDQENHLVLVRGGIPGSRGSYVYLTREGETGREPSPEQDG